MSEIKHAVLYHDDADGFGAAYAIWLWDQENAPSLERLWIPVQYGQLVPELPDTIEQLVIVDFSYKRAICEELAQKYQLLILDHHKTAAEELKELPYAIFDQSMSGAALTWLHFHGAKPMPNILHYVQDYDLWRFELPYSEEVNLFISTLPRDFYKWQKFTTDQGIDAGCAIKAFRDAQIARARKNVWMENVAGYLVPITNASENISELGNQMCHWFPECAFLVSYCDRPDGVRSYSLRSVGEFDVSEIARQFGGGGHRNAAGFTANLIMAAPSAFTHDAMQNALSDMQVSIDKMLKDGTLSVS